MRVLQCILLQQMKKMKNELLAIIDADGLAFHSLRETIEESIQIMDEKIKNIFSKTMASHYVMFLSKGKYFRHTIFPEYKQFRKKYEKKVTWTKTLKAFLEEKYNAVWMENVEADDLCAFFYNFHDDPWIGEMAKSTIKIPKDKILCTPDKDLLYNIPSKHIKGHFNYSYSLENREDPDSLIKGWWIETNFKTAKTNFWISLITGDTADGIPGIPRKGIKYAEKLLEGLSDDIPPMEIILQEYIKHFGEATGIFEFQKNYRLLKLLNCEEDYGREGLKSPLYLYNKYKEGIIFETSSSDLW